MVLSSNTDLGGESRTGRSFLSPGYIRSLVGGTFKPGNLVVDGSLSSNTDLGGESRTLHSCLPPGYIRSLVGGKFKPGNNGRGHR